MTAELRKIAATVIGGLLLAGILALFNIANRLTAVEVTLRYLHGQDVLKEAK